MTKKLFKPEGHVKTISKLPIIIPIFLAKRRTLAKLIEIDQRMFQGMSG